MRRYLIEREILGAGAPRLDCGALGLVCAEVLVH